jgi:hypothetical protein
MGTYHIEGDDTTVDNLEGDCYKGQDRKCTLPISFPEIDVPLDHWG